MPNNQYRTNLQFLTEWIKSLPEDNSCMEWPRTRNGEGYGVVSIWKSGRRKDLRAHRVAYELTHGPIPAGLLVRHTCDNPPCVNPNHLLLGTDADNCADRDRRRRTATGEKRPKSKLTPAKVVAIRACFANGSTLRGLAREYGVHDRTIRAVVERTKWKFAEDAVLADVVNHVDILSCSA